jgi:hypothetical protein
MFVAIRGYVILSVESDEIWVNTEANEMVVGQFGTVEH